MLSASFYDDRSMLLLSEYRYLLLLFINQRFCLADKLIYHSVRHTSRSANNEVCLVIYYKCHTFSVGAHHLICYSCISHPS